MNQQPCFILLPFINLEGNEILTESGKFVLERLASGVKFAVGAEKDVLLPSQVLDDDGAIIWVHHLKGDWKFESGIESSVGGLYCAIRDNNVEVSHFRLHK